MAIGFTPKHIEDFPLNDLTPEQFLVIAIGAAGRIGWQVAYISASGLIAYTDNGMFSWNAEIRIKIEDGIAQLKSVSTGSEMMDWGKNKKNIARFIESFNELRPAFTEEDLALQYEVLKAQFPPEEADILTLPPPSTREQVLDFISVFKPAKGYFITPILLDLNILIFILMVITGVNIMEPDSESLLKWGGNFRPLTLEGQWWRLLTNCFLHIGIVHLLMNMYALVFIGFLLEPHLGKARFFSAYLLTGIAASMVSLYWHELTISAGASGAIFGMYGVFLAMLTTNLIEKRARKALMASIGIFVAYNLVYGVKGGIDNAAHIGGLVSGIFIGYAFIPSLKKPEAAPLKFATIGILTVLILASSFAVFTKIPNDIGTYDAKMKEFVVLEKKALDIYNMPKNTGKDALVASLKDSGIYYWNENIRLLDEAEKLHLPDVIHERNKKLKRYCELRIRSYELVARALDEETDKYQEQIENYNRKIEAVIDELNGKSKPIK